MVVSMFCKYMVLESDYIKIKEEHRGSDYTITTNGNKSIQTTIADTSHTLNEWLQEMHRIHSNKENDNIMVTLCAATIQSDGSLETFIPPWVNGWSRPSPPIHMLKFGVGSYCLLLNMSSKSWKTDAKHAFKGFITSNKLTFLVGSAVGLMGELERVYNFRVAKTINLCDLQTQAGFGYPGCLGLSRQNFVKILLGDDIDFDKPDLHYWRNPTKIKCWEEGGNRGRNPVYSHDNVKFSTIETYIYHQVALYFMKIVHDRTMGKMS